MSLVNTADYDTPGSWGPASNGWPETHEEAHDKWVFCNKTKIIPYGSYVLMTDNYRKPNESHYLRVETQELLDKLNKAWSER